MANKKYINTSEVAELTGRNPEEIRELIKSGVLPGHKSRKGWWRLNVPDVESYFGIQINKPEMVEDNPVWETKLIVNEEHYDDVIQYVCKAKSSIKIMTGDFKLFRLKPTKEQGKRYGNGTAFIDYLATKVKQGIDVQVIISKPSQSIDEKLEVYYQQTGSYPFSICNCIRNHAKTIIIDDRIAYIGSANLTKAGLGQYIKCNIEAGILTHNSEIISSLNELFSKIWRGDFCEACHINKKCPEY